MARFLIIAILASVAMLAGHAFAQAVFVQDFEALPTGSAWLNGSICQLCIRGIDKLQTERDR